jgi:hypothetical protein
MQKIETDYECFDCPHPAWTPADGVLDTRATWLDARRHP